MYSKAKSYSIKENEEEIVKYWEDNQVFLKSIEKNKNNDSFVFYDGPPFATGLPHYGHILAGYIKDTIGRWATINGYHVPRRAGWDTHGLPIEYEIEKKYNIKTKQQVEEFGIFNYNEACRDIVMSYASEWKTTMNRLGRWVDFDNDYKTMDLDYMSKVWNVFSRIYKKNMIYEGVKIMPYSIACTTPLSNFEANSNYKDVVDRTIVVKFELKENKNHYILSWTTTPWTLPGHYSLCINPNLTYVLVENKEEKYYICKSRISFIEEKLKTQVNIIKEISGKELLGLEYIPPYNFMNKEKFTVIGDNFVTDDSGTGIVHIAPAYGEDDYRVSIENNLITKDLHSLYIHIDESGFGYNCGQFNTMNIKTMTKEVIKNLKENNKLLFDFDYNHNYPHCWRSDTPLIYKAVKCWFLNVENIKERMIELNKTINWIPGHVGQNRFNNWLESTRDWCISRNRYWGTPIPIWKSDDGDILVIESKEHLEELTNKEITDIHRHHIDNIIITKDGKTYKRDSTVLDCWFESGSVPFASPVTGFPANFIAEGLDQTRGWFYTLLVISTILEDNIPFKNVIVNGLVLASDGKKMSKRLKNYPDPLEIVNKYGADALRYYLLVSPASMAEALRFKDSEVKEVLQSTIIPLTNSLTFFEVYHKLYTKDKEFIEVESTLPFDKWILNKTAIFLIKYSEYLNKYEINPISNLVYNYIEDLNNNYIKLNRDILKGKEGDDKCIMALSTLKKVLTLLSVYLSPILPFFSEKIYQKLVGTNSVHLCYIKDYKFDNYLNQDEDIKMIDNMLNVITMIRKVRSDNNLQNKLPLKKIEIYAEEKNLELLNLTESYFMKEGNILDIEYKKWEATKYNYEYTYNHMNVGKTFRKNKKQFEEFVSNLSQEVLEKMYYGETVKYENYDIDKTYVNIIQIIPNNENKEYKTQEDKEMKIKIKLNIIIDEYTNELYIAKNIATSFQKLRKLGGYQPYDNLKLYMKNNTYSNIVEKHMEYIMATTRVTIELVDELLQYDYHNVFEINEEECELYLMKI